MVAGADTFIWSSGTVGSSGEVFAGSGSTTDTLQFEPGVGVTLMADGLDFSAFEVFEKSGAGAVIQVETLEIDSVTISEGSYTLSSAMGSPSAIGVFEIENDLTVSGGSLGGAGDVTFTGTTNTFTLSGGMVLMAIGLGGAVDSFEWSGGILGGAVDLGAGADTVTLSAGGVFTTGGSVAGGADSDTIELTGADNFDLDASKFTGFEALTKADTSSVTLTSSLTLTTGAVTVDAGELSVASGATLTTATTTLSGAGTRLKVAGVVVGTVGVASGDNDGQVVEISSAGAFAAAVNLGGGEDTLIIDSSAAALSLDATQAGYYSNIETLVISGSNNVTWGAGITFGGSSSWDTLQFVNSGPTFTVTGTLAFDDGAALDLSRLADAASTITLTATMITLPSTTTSGGLTITLPADFTSTLTLTLTNVMGGAGLDQTTELAKLTVQDAKATPTPASVTVSGSPVYTDALYTLTLSITVPTAAAVFTNASGTFTLTSGSFGDTFPASVINILMQGGNLDASGGVTLTGDSTVTWQNGRIVSTINAAAGSGLDTLALQPSNGVLLNFNGASFTGFEVLTKSGAGAVLQSSTLDLGGSGSITISAGTYTIGAGFELQGNSLTVSGGSLSGAGSVVLGPGNSSFTLSGGAVSVAVALGAGANTFTWSGGSFTSVTGGADIDTLKIAGNTVLTFDPSTITAFEVLQMTSTATVTQAGTLNLDSNGVASFSAGSYVINANEELIANRVTLSGGSLGGAGKLSLSAGNSFLTLSDGTLNVVVDLSGGDDTFTMSGGSVGASGMVVGGGGSDTLQFEGIEYANNITFDGSKFTGFEVLDLEDRDDDDNITMTMTVTQTGALDLTNSNTTFGRFTADGGSYIIAASATLTVQNMTITGTSVSGDGSIAFSTGVYSSNFIKVQDGSNWSIALDTGAGGDTFTFRRGATLSSTVDLGAGTDTLEFDATAVFASGGSVAGGAGSSDSIRATAGSDFSLDGSKFTQFESFTKRGSEELTLSASLDLTSAGTVTVEAGTLSIASGVTLTAASTELSGAGTRLKILGTLIGTIGVASGDAVGQIVEISRTGAIATAVDLGDGDDTLIIDASSAGLLFSATQAGYYSNIETLAIVGANTVGWGAGITFGGATGWDTLKLSSSGATFAVTGTLAFEDGATLDLSGLEDADSTLILDATLITLPATTANDGLTVVLPENFASTLTLTLKNVVGGEGVNRLIVLNKFNVEDSTGAAIGLIGVADDSDPDYTLGNYTIVLTTQLVLEAAEITNASGTFTLTAGNYKAAFPAGVTNLTIAGGVFNPSNTATLDGDSTLLWQSGRIVATVNATAGAGVDTINLQTVSSVDLILDGALFVGFEALIKTGAGTVLQNGTLDLGATGTVTISAGTYAISAGSVLQSNSVTVAGGVLAGAGMVTLGTADSTFTFSSGTVSVAVAGGGGSDTLALQPTTGVSLSLDGSLFTAFAALTKSGAGTVVQSGTLNLGAAGTVTMSGGSFEIASGATLTAASFALNGADSKLVLSGTYAGTITGGALGQVLEISGGTVSGAIDLGAGADSLLLSSGTVSGAIDLGDGADSLTVSGGSFSGSGTISGGTDAASDSIVLSGSSAFTLDGTKFTDFEELTLATNITVTLSENMTVGTATISDGTLSINSGKFLSISSALTVSGGTLTGAGNVNGTSDANTFTLSGGTLSVNVNLLGDDDRFIWSGGTITGSGVEIKGGSGIDTLRLQPATGVTLQLHGARFISFEMLEKTGAGRVTQQSTLNILDSATISEGIYALSHNDELKITNDLTVSGGTLSGQSTDSVEFQNSSGDETENTFTLSGGTVSVAVNLGGEVDEFVFSGGTLSRAVDLGAGDDKVTLTGGAFGSGGSVKGGAGSDTIALTGSTDFSFDGSKFTQFEALTKDGTHEVTLTNRLDIR